MYVIIYICTYTRITRIEIYFVSSDACYYCFIKDTLILHFGMTDREVKCVLVMRCISPTKANLKNYWWMKNVRTQAILIKVYQIHDPKKVGYQLNERARLE